MIKRENLTVAVPWSLSHYIALNGFHPLYRTLFDQAPSSVEFHAWDNVKLHNRFSRDIEIRKAVLSAADAAERKSQHLVTGSVASTYQDFFWAPNQALTNELMGDIEFHHTAPFPSLERPFVFHCESFAPIFFPFSQQGSGEFEKTEEIREYYRGLFANPLCLGIFSHIPETLVSLNCFFSDPIIESKLFSSRIGLSSKAFADPGLPEKSVLSVPKFLFVNSAHQNPANFFRRGGHLVLRFWKEFKKTGRDGLLMLRCEKPSESELLEHGVDVSFLSAELGHSILWAKDYLANHEMNALMANAHFFLLPSASLHSASIMHAMTLGTIPVVTDTVGTSVYVTDNEHGIILEGVRSAIWHTDPNTGVLVDHYDLWESLDDGLVFQMTARILSLLDAPDGCQKMSSRTMAHARKQFSGQAFSNNFWGAVSDLYQRHKQSSLKCEPVSQKMASSLSDCTLQGDGWSRVFESPTQPLRKIYTGQSVVIEMGGAFIHAYGNPVWGLSDLSVMAQYLSSSAPRTTFANTVEELGGKYLPFVTGLEVGGIRNRKIVEFVSRILMPAPALHSFASRFLKRFRHYRRYFAFKLGQPTIESDIELVLHGVSGYNIIRYYHKYYAIPQEDGEFSPKRIRMREYASYFSGYSLDKVLLKIAASVSPSNLVAFNDNVSVEPKLAFEGYHGFNIIQLGGEYHAILQSEGAFDYAKALSKKYRHSFSGRSIAEVQSAIEASIDP